MQLITTLSALALSLLLLSCDAVNATTDTAEDSHFYNRQLAAYGPGARSIEMPVLNRVMAGETLVTDAWLIKPAIVEDQKMISIHSNSPTPQNIYIYETKASARPNERLVISYEFKQLINFSQWVYVELQMGKGPEGPKSISLIPNSLLYMPDGWARVDEVVDLGDADELIIRFPRILGLQGSVLIRNIDFRLIGPPQ